METDDLVHRLEASINGRRRKKMTFLGIAIVIQLILIWTVPVQIFNASPWPIIGLIVMLLGFRVIDSSSTSKEKQLKILLDKEISSLLPE